MKTAALEILGLTSAEFIPAAATFGVKRADALQIYRNAFRDGIIDQQLCAVPFAPIVNTHLDHDTTKFIQRHDDGLETESVILPYRSTAGRARNTLCVSSQVGCAMGCTFCETAQMGLMRNLTAAQIVGQWWAAKHLAIWRSGGMAKPPNHVVAPSPNLSINNIVFMGMGEPMENLDHVIQSIRVLTDRNGAAIAPAHIAVSTVGRPCGILRLAALAREHGFRKLRLAVSINAPNDEIRSRIMPINKSAPMDDLMQAIQQWPTDGRQRVLIEYVLIPGVNDALEHADQLCNYLRPLPCTVNVIPYNPRRDSPWPAPTEACVNAFVQRIHERGQFVKRRQTLGRSVMAACGQLGNPSIRGRRIITA